MNEIILTEQELPFDLDLTFSCGQIFGWKKEKDTWKGVHQGRIITISQTGKSIRYSGCQKKDIFRFLGLADNITEIYQSIHMNIKAYNHGKQDPFFTGRYEISKGIRILRQDPWECLVSFICSSNSNVRTIGKRITLLMERYGSLLSRGENIFPDVPALSDSREDDLRKCLTGYRASYLKGSAEYIRSHPDLFFQVSILPYSEARKALMILPGVGPKVADCILLFAFERMEAVPVDIRIRKIVTEQYAGIIDRENPDQNLSYDDIADFCRLYFGPYAGYAQQYLFATRDITESELKT